MAKAAANKKPDILHTISEATSGLVGKDLLEELCRNFTRALHMQFALIAECSEEDSTQVRTLCMVNGDSVMDNIEYDTTGRPCELILQGKEIFVPRDVYKKFPEARGIEAATGVPIHSSVTGKIIGHIIISNLQPITEESNQTTILKIFASRIGAEIERMKAEKKLEKKNAELHQRLYEIELYDTTLKNLREQVYWLDSDGKFIRVNAAVSKETGYNEGELHTMTVFDINPALTREEWDAHWKETKQLGHQVLETEHQSKDGRRYPVEVTNNFLEHDGHEYFCSTVRDIRQRKMEEELLRTVSEATSGLTGEDFLVELARHITITLKMRYALITECANEEKTRLRTLCYVDGEKILDNIEYDTAGIPCEIIMTGKEFFMARDVQLNYPKEKGIESAVGVPIYSSKSGEIIGHILALDPQPVTTEKNQTSILKIFAARIGAEMERMKAEEKLKIANAELQILLKESDQRYRDLFEEAPIAYVHEGLDSKFIKANRAALRILGVRPDEVPYTYGKTLAPDTPDAQRRLKEAFDSIGRGTDTSGVVLELRRKDNGKPIWIQWWSNPDAGGQFTRTMFVDITDKVLMEQEQARLQAQNKYLQEEIKLTYNFEEIISKSNNFQKVLQQIEQVASTDATVLILGESGTGKELIARAVHNVSNRSKRPLVKVNCATLPANLIESELFGHEKGAFTGAMERKIGRFELADGGSIFLDEIGELPVELQAKLLRVLQEGEFERLGNPKTMKVNVRVIAATNRNLQQAIEKKEFREDLYYRLNVFPIICPPLRKRKEDIPLLIKHFCQKHEGKIGKKVTNVPADVIEALMTYDWPGNIRELENIIERAMILSRNGSLEYGDWIPTEKIDDSTNGVTATTARLEDVEKEHIIEILKKTGWKVSGEKGAAKILGLNATTLEARMKKLGIKRETHNL
ncbi:sigma-54-dependent Fis family transcriptional regulator [Terrimonas alba]|uniref:sigma-54-dependent Fis family transcriptional regulator n=1 Tax=Terrimonas alba TaxID=3349636 RepID=UPI0035F3DEDB